MLQFSYHRTIAATYNKHDCDTQESQPKLEDSGGTVVGACQHMLPIRTDCNGLYAIFVPAIGLKAFTCMSTTVPESWYQGLY